MSTEPTAKELKAAAHQGRVEVRFHNIDELFDQMDPAPIEERDLDLDAEEFITSWAREIPRDANLRLQIDLPEDQRKREPEKFVQPAIKRFFEYKADMAGREFKDLMRRGRINLIIGIAVLGACMLIRELMARAGESAAQHEFHLAGEAIIIIGWVAMWRPVEILLYEWWPVKARQRTYRRLSAMPVNIEYR
ncbi:MAG: hypothetical protein IT462_00175 [Planctomycetes bacterium]|nr:hypothetical protein [Planctomycetota bacterium]